MPPTPVQARNQQISRYSGEDAKYDAPAMMEYVRMLSAIAFDRPMRSPSLPNRKPPAAAPNRNEHWYHANQRAVKVFHCLY
jgi:hypothetical protein